MSKITIKSGKGKLILKKSRRLVGLKSKKKKDFKKSSFVKDEVYQISEDSTWLRLTAKGDRLMPS